MIKKIKSILRRTPGAIRVYRMGKNAVVYPLRFTPLRVLQLKNMPLVDLLNFQKISLLRKVAPYSKAGYPRLSNVYQLALEIERKGIRGDFVECGTWKGGCSAIMGAVANRFGNRRKTWYLDSFEGMPEKPSEKDVDNPEEIMGDVLKASVSDVEELIFRKLHLPKDKNIIIKGWFQDTFPKIKNRIGSISLLRLDADWYEATLYCLRELYDQVVPGGYIIFDDFSRWEGCRIAIREFIAERSINPHFQFIGTYGKRVMYFRKER